MKNVKRIILTLIITMIFGMTNVYAEEAEFSEAFNKLFPEGKFATTIYKESEATLTEEEINLYSQIINNEIKDLLKANLDETYTLDFNVAACLADSTKCTATLTQTVAEEPVEETPAEETTEETTEPVEESTRATAPIVETHQVEIVYAELTEEQANEVATIKSELEANNHFLVVGEREFDFLNSLMTSNGSYNEIIDYSEDFDSLRDKNKNIDYLFTKTSVTQKDAYNLVSGRLEIYYRTSGETILVGYTNIVVEEQMTFVIPENYYDEEGVLHDITTSDELVSAFTTRLTEIYKNISLSKLTASVASVSSYNFDDMTLEVPSGKTKAEYIKDTYDANAIEVTYGNLSFKVLLKKDNSAITRTVEYKDATTKAKKTIELAHNTIINVYAENELDINQIIVNDNIEIEDLSREYYVFIGYEKTTNEEGQLVFTPKFELVDFKIIYNNMDNANNSNPTTYTIETATFSLTAPSREGYIFTGWTTADSEELLETITIEQGSTGDKEVTANWKIKTYTITYKDYESGQNEEISLKYGDTINVCKSKDECETITINDKTKLSTPENPGYTFKGFTKVDENGKISLIGNYDIEEYTITYEGIENDTTGNPTKYTVESDDIKLVNPEKEGYEFTGWTSEDSTEPVLDVTIPKGTTGNKTYKANWEELGVGEIGEEEEETTEPEAVVTEEEDQTEEEVTTTTNKTTGTNKQTKPSKTDDKKNEEKPIEVVEEPEIEKTSAPILFIIAGCIIFVALAGFAIYFLTSREEKNN